ELKRIMRQTYELFSARGISSLYTIQFQYMRPKHLAEMKENDFYKQLMTEVRKQRQQELELLHSQELVN
ncbi:15787_t:CDS:1, partial [Funneliformis caledonium]